MHREIAGKLTGPVTKWLVLVGALVLVGIMAPLNAKLIDVQNNEASSWLPASAESTKVVEELTGTVDPNDIPTLVVYHRAGGLTDADLAAMDEDAQKIADIRGVTDKGAISPNAAAALAAQGQHVPPLISQDREVAYVAFTFNFGSNGWLDIPDAADQVRDIAKIDGVSVHLAGYGGQAADASEAFAGIDTNLIFIALFVVIIILLLTYRSPILWLLPIISAGFSYMIAGGVVYLLAKYADLTVNGQSQSILGILVIGAGTDYALLLVARYREELRRHENRHQAMAFGLHRAAPAILASAATVVIGMLCLVFADLNSTAGLGPVLAVGVAVTYLVMVTLLPALLVICGRWIFWPKRPTFGSPEPTGTGVWSRVGRRITGADALVGGGSAFYLDNKIASQRDSRVIIPIVLVVVLLILVLLLRALLAPLILMGTVILSFGAALGISALLFTEVFTRIGLFETNEGFAHTDPGFPLFTFVFLVALGIDYNIFLMTRVREETINHDTRKGALIALSSTGGVITSAGAVLAATFLVLGSLPLVFLAELGTAVALGVLLDTMIVRSVLVTAINLDLGAKIWWPSKLDSGSRASSPPAAESELANA